MIVTRAPLRVTFGGGGSDLEPGGLCVTAAIRQYVTVTLADSFDPTYVLHYSKAEEVERIADIKHRVLRDTLRRLRVSPGIQIATAADIPAGTGLGSSGAFTVALLKALLPDASRPLLARLACDIDLGQQDQWAAIYGGVNVFDFDAGTIRPVDTNMDRWLSLRYTGIRHDAAEVLTGQTIPRDENAVDAAVVALENDDPRLLGRLLTAQWEAKYERAPTEAHQRIDRMIRGEIAAGAYGAKLVGAGDGGFLLVCADRSHRPVEFDHEGVKCM